MAVAVLCLLLFLLQILHNFHFLVTAAVIQSQIQRQLVHNSGTDFISIDCGLEGVPYYDRKSGLRYTSDEKYISTGRNMGISTTFYGELGDDLLKTVRSFPEGNKNCYNLHPLRPQKKYLIRARFMYGNYDGGSSVPVFDVYIDVQFWFSLTLTSIRYRLFQEIIHVATTESIEVCLINTGQGTPFISALELRPLDDLSPYPASSDFSLAVWTHDDIGGLEIDGESYPVKDDAYDRLWFRDPRWNGWNIIKTTKSFGDSRADPCKVPSTVLATAGEQNDGLDSKTVYIEVYNPAARVYAFWHFAELELLGSNDTREFTVSAPGYTSGPISPKYLQLTTVSSPRISLDGSEKFWYTLKKTPKSSRYPILNAFELYTVLDHQVSPTDKRDVDAINEIKATYVRKNWQGDPCLPKYYPWDGLNCTYEDENAPAIRVQKKRKKAPIITKLSLPSSNLSGNIPPSISNLTALESLNLSNNNLKGTIPEYLADLVSLMVIDLSENNLKGPVPPKLVEKANKIKGFILRLKGNLDVCKTYPCDVFKKRHHFIVPVVTSAALVSLLAIFFLASIWKKKGFSFSYIIKICKLKT